MKYLKQFFLIILISFIGEILHAVIPLPIPASIYGIVLLFTGLMTGIVPLKAVKDAGFSFHVWTIDHLDRAKQAFAAGADTLTTNRAKFILESYREEAK